MSPVLHRKIGHHHSFPPKIKDRVKERSIKPPQELTWIQTATLKLLENHMLQEKQVVVKVVRVRVASFARACLWCCWVFCLLSGCLFEKLGQRVIFSLISAPSHSINDANRSRGDTDRGGWNGADGDRQPWSF
ncbi:uncharacterized protein LOC102711259 isoform X2 [Oryza brachyantha]|uniref:uncharacterized protein LOC102711259 isoform X2 n=1 Tax=Oryza brachyantha TaxID=4533 RepID=UPI000776486D|nr:uncharacterized protein LOC102711259 isoform X2 [Oryza brachyantha]